MSRTRLLQIYRTLHLARFAQERLRARAVHRPVGPPVSLPSLFDDASVAAAGPLRTAGPAEPQGTHDVVVQTEAGPGTFFIVGGTPEAYFRRALGGGNEEDGAVLGPAAPLKSLVEVAAGVTLSFRMREDARVGMVFSAPGTPATGAWHEGLNFAAVRRCPLVVVVAAPEREAPPPRRGSRLGSFQDICRPYGIEGNSVEASDLPAVYQWARTTVARARRGKGVQLLELRHSELRQGDAAGRLARRLLEDGHATEGELADLEEDAEVEVAAAWERVASGGVPSGRDVLRGVWGDLELHEPWWRRPDGTPHEPHLSPTRRGEP